MISKRSGLYKHLFIILITGVWGIMGSQINAFLRLRSAVIHSRGGKKRRHGRTRSAVTVSRSWERGSRQYWPSAVACKLINKEAAVSRGRPKYQGVSDTEINHSANSLTAETILPAGPPSP